MVCLVSCLMTACTATPRPAAPSRPARINHVVFFALNDPDDAGELIRDCTSMRTTVPGIVSSYAGTQLDTAREGVASDYDVGFYVGFMSEDDYQTYLDHPAHLEVVKKWRPRLRRLQVYDVIDETP
ncbi:MAG: Dabb family protein [Planctomycetota bacterium]